MYPEQKMVSIFDDKTIVITGGTGSFGIKFTDLIFKTSAPHSVRIFSRSELLQMQMKNIFQDNRLRFLIGDVRDRNRVYRALNGVDIIIHAAALKQVPTCEYNPIEAVRTNIEGSINIIDAAIDNQVEKVMAISTDKAVHPVNLYGATKMVAEKLFIQANTYTGGKKTKFSCVRYGNVVGSRGSVIPLFKEQKESGKITITDERMTRFWITLEQGARFVMQSLEMMKGGEIFVPKIPSMKILDLAEAIAPNVNKRILGFRPGEKLHEVLITEDESRHTKEFDSYYIIEPEHAFWGKQNFPDGKSLPEGFRYSSENNIQWLTESELKTIIDNV
jgi:UDP-N-acetylglucosamine 4,6-dehydratase (inverting)